MITTRVKVDRTEYAVNHNGDWSGDAMIRVVQREDSPVIAILPGRLLLAIGRHATLQEVIAQVENMMDGMP